MLGKTTRILFFGIYNFGLFSLDSLIRHGFNIVGVVTKPAGPGETQVVAEFARLNKLPLLAPETPRYHKFDRQIRRLQPELIVVAGYHKKIPPDILGIPPLGVINLHAGLLPAYRGPCTWKWALINGDSLTGVTVHDMTPELDKGDIIAQRSFAIADDDTAGSLFDKFCIHGAELLRETLEQWAAGSISRVAQDESLASYFSYPTDEDACITWYAEAQKIRNLIRGLNPSPGAWTQYLGTRLIIGSAEVQKVSGSGDPGRIIDWDNTGIVVGTATDDLVIGQLRLVGHPETGIRDVVRKLGIGRGEGFARERVAGNL